MIIFVRSCGSWGSRHGYIRVSSLSHNDRVAIHNHRIPIAVMMTLSANLERRTKTEEQNGRPERGFHHDMRWYNIVVKIDFKIDCGVVKEGVLIST